MEDLNKVSEELERKLEELKSKQTEALKEDSIRTVDMDEDDKLRLENVMLRQKLMERELSDVKDGFHLRLIRKYNVDPSVETVSVDPQTGKITIAPR